LGFRQLIVISKVLRILFLAGHIRGNKPISLTVVSSGLTSIAVKLCRDLGFNTLLTQSYFALYATMKKSLRTLKYGHIRKMLTV
jgi:hypothetical protein